jgi:uncharacterized protein (DUF1697 family)
MGPIRRQRRGTAAVYVALLRGINVGGKNLVSMKALKASFERLGFADVDTYINSGNVVFRSTEADPRALERRIDRMLSREHGLPTRTVVRSAAEMARLVDTIDESWQIDSRWRYNVIFLRHTIDSARVLAGIELKPDIEQVVYCPGTLLWSAQLSALTRTAMLKMASRPIYKDMTVRSVRTTRTILALMQRIEQE